MDEVKDDPRHENSDNSFQSHVLTLKAIDADPTHHVHGGIPDPGYSIFNNPFPTPRTSRPTASPSQRLADAVAQTVRFNPQWNSQNEQEIQRVQRESDHLSDRAHTESFAQHTSSVLGADKLGHQGNQVQIGREKDEQDVLEREYAQHAAGKVESDSQGSQADQLDVNEEEKMDMRAEKEAEEQEQKLRRAIENAFGNDEEPSEQRRERLRDEALQNHQKLQKQLQEQRAKLGDFHPLVKAVDGEDTDEDSDGEQEVAAVASSSTTADFLGQSNVTLGKFCRRSEDCTTCATCMMNNIYNTWCHQGQKCLGQGVAYSRPFECFGDCGTTTTGSTAYCNFDSETVSKCQSTRALTTIAFTVVGLFVVACVLYGIVAAVRNWNELVAEAERQDELRQEQAERKAFAWAQSSFRRDPPKRVLSREESYSYTPGFYRAAHPVFGGHNYSEPSRRREPSVQPFTADSYQTATPKVETNPSLRKEIAQAPHARPMSWADPNPAPEMPRPNLGLYRGSQ